MALRQSIDDLILKLREDRKTQVIACVIVIFLVWGIFGDAKKQRIHVEPDIIVDTGATANEETRNDFMIAYGQKIDKAQSEAQKNAQNLQEMSEKIARNEEQTAAIMKRMLEKMADLENTVTNASIKQEQPVDIEGEEIIEQVPEGLESFGELENSEVEIPAPPKEQRLAVIGTGDSVKVKLLAGVHAPVDGTPYPVVMELIDDVIGPDGTTLPLGNARLLAAAQGSLTDQRALFRLHTLNISLPNGARKIVPVDGWVVGEDGLSGMEGILIDPIGRAMAGSLLAGTVEGVGEGLSESQVNTYSSAYGVSRIVEGELWEYGAGKGVEKAGEKWADFIEERADMMVPHVRVLSGRTATAVFSSSKTIDGLYDALTEGEEEAVFVSLD
ncbi:MAG: TraB/VirB10 family protein [Bdellovibrionota bacterium]|jgi:hypothetical protein